MKHQSLPCPFPKRIDIYPSHSRGHDNASQRQKQAEFGGKPRKQPSPQQPEQHDGQDDPDDTVTQRRKGGYKQSCQNHGEVDGPIGKRAEGEETCQAEKRKREGWGGREGEEGDEEKREKH